MNTKSKDSKKNGKSQVATTLKELFIDGLKDIYWAEQSLVKTLPEMFDYATNQKLKTALKDHLEITKDHVTRLEQIFKVIGLKPEGKKCLAIEGIINEGNEIVEETMEGPVRDAGIIASAQKVEHYEIATYGTLAAFAKTLNEREALELLLKTLGEEKKSDTLLSFIADTNLNSQAVDGKLQSKDLNAV
ncbi:MAG TPA: ferritin-like domain-containing protein [Edaphocola sp.]|nr:ferritin-like domain-containing protein [Edaphocola sp.]